MKPICISPFLVTLGLMAVAPKTSAAILDYYQVGRSAYFRQNSNSAPTNSLNWLFTGNLCCAVAGGVTTLTITTPTGVTLGETGDVVFFSGANFSSRASLEAVFPAGPYTFTATAGTFAPASAVVTLPTVSVFPSRVPFFGGDTFTRLASYNPSVPFTFVWNQLPVDPNATNQFVGFSIARLLSFEIIFSSNSPSIKSLTSARVPAGALEPNTAYRASLDFQNQLHIPDAGFGDYDSDADFSYITDTIFVTGDAIPAAHAIYSFVQNRTVFGEGRVARTDRRGFLVVEPDTQRGTEIVAFVLQRTNKLFAVIPRQYDLVDHVKGDNGATYTIIAKAQSPSTQFAGTQMQAVYLRGRDSAVTIGPEGSRPLPRTMVGWTRDITQNPDSALLAADESSATYTLNVRASAESNAAGETFAETVARLASTYVARGYRQMSLPPAP